MNRPDLSPIAEASVGLGDAPVFARHESTLPGIALGDEGLFLQAWLGQPVTIGAIMPTRAPLARAMAAAAASAKGAILELGGGTGPITRALLASGISPERVTVVERNRVFHRLLARRFPGVRVLCGDAEELGALLEAHEIGPVGAVLSSLPRVGWPLARQRHILDQCFERLVEDGLFLEFSYGPFSPVPRALRKELGLRARRLRRVWGNILPATVWGYSRG